jgi:hypothetical protein
VVFGVLAWKTRRAEQRRSEARVAALAAALDGGGSEADAPAMFMRPRAGVRRNPILSAAAGVAVTVALVVGAAMATRQSANPASSAARTPSDAPLELLAMRDVRDRDTLTISGLVRNARRGSEVDHVTAVVVAYGRDGHSLGTAKAPLEVPRLRPGEESPFVVSLPGMTGVQRYRVTFRGSGGVVRHIDRRAAAAGRADRRTSGA